MDIAATPDTAEAAPVQKEPPLIRREDYAPFPWRVPSVTLDFALGLDETLVTATLEVERNEAAQASPTLRLNGDTL